MRTLHLACWMIGAMAAPLAVPALAQQRPDPATLPAAHRDAMATFGFMDGVWRGPATTVLPSGATHAITQTERIGPLLGGAVNVVQGRRGCEPDGTTSFNALGVISHDVASKTYSMRTHAMGYAGDYVVRRTSDGFAWEIPAGPMTIRNTASVKDGAWNEVGDRIAPGKDPVRCFEMTLKRIADSDWPQAGTVAPR